MNIIFILRTGIRYCIWRSGASYMAGQLTRFRLGAVVTGAWKILIDVTVTENAVAWIYS
jgi:hypothetical protein